MPIQWNEKRRFTRINLKTPLRCQIRGTSQFNNTVSEDIGVGGVAFVSDDFIALNTPVNIEINVVSRMLTATGRIARINSIPYSNKYHLGIEFIGFEKEQKKYLSDYINMRQYQIHN